MEEGKTLREIYLQLKVDNKDKNLKYHVLIASSAVVTYYIDENPDRLTPTEMLAVIEKGAQNFGWRVEGNTIVVYID